MKLLISIFVFTLVTVFGLPSKAIKSRRVVVPAGKPEGRISHGWNALPGQFPYQVGLSRTRRSGGHTWCGGSLISHTEVLTAAHCGTDAVKVEVLLGCTDRSDAGVTYEVAANDILVHPGWNNDTLENDIAIIRIPYTEYSEKIQPVKLPAKGSPYHSFVGETALASGWGRIAENIPGITSHLQYAHLNIIPNSACEQYFIMPTSQICVSTYSGVSTCNGDSGGPLVLENSKILVGVTSYISKRGCEENLPAVFTRVTSYLDWIEQNSSVRL